MYSYADDRPYTFPGAGGVVYMLNNGARSVIAPEGGMVSVGADSTAAMTSTNASIQATVLGDSGLSKNPLRPFGSTPTAALVTDLQYFLQNDADITAKTVDPGPGDPYYGCRARSAVLITDGFPNGDMRGTPVNCEALGQPVGAAGCPYEEVADTVSSMIANGELDKFYVIGFALDGDAAQVAAVEALLNDIASVGGTDQAFLVADRAELVTALSTALNEQNPGATSRTAPVATGLSHRPQAPGLVQAEFISGFNASVDANDPWDGILERRRIECVSGIPVAQTVDDTDRFHLLLNSQTVAPSDVDPWGSDAAVSFTGGFSRNLWTVLPTDPADINGHLTGDGRNKLTPPSLSDNGVDVPTAGGELTNVPVGEFSTEHCGGVLWPRQRRRRCGPRHDRRLGTWGRRKWPRRPALRRHLSLDPGDRRPFSRRHRRSFLQRLALGIGAPAEPGRSRRPVRRRLAAQSTPARDLCGDERRYHPRLLG